MRRLLFLLALLGTPALARDSLGMFGEWGAFRDPSVPRCYALAKALPSTQTVPQAIAGLKRYFQFYNAVRPHQSLDYKTPAAIYQSSQDVACAA